jgi:hypothetical protein
MTVKIFDGDEGRACALAGETAGIRAVWDMRVKASVNVAVTNFFEAAAARGRVAVGVTKLDMAILQRMGARLKPRRAAHAARH